MSQRYTTLKGVYLDSRFSLKYFLFHLWVLLKEIVQREMNVFCKPEIHVKKHPNVKPDHCGAKY